MMARRFLWSFVAALVICGLPMSASAPAQERQEGGADGQAVGQRGINDREVGERAERRKALRKLAGIMDKIRAGEELTREEQKLWAKARKRRAEAARAAAERNRVMVQVGPGEVFANPMGKPDAPQNRRLRYDPRLNVVDIAHYRIAEIRIARKQYEKAVVALEQLIKKPASDLAVSLTHLNLAELYRRQIANPQKAIEEYKKVTGEFAREAQMRLAQMFEELDQVDEAVEQFEGIVKSSTDPVQKVLALRALAELLERNGREDEAIAVLQRLIQSVSYDQAARISTVLRKAQKQREQQQKEAYERRRMQMMQRWQQRWRARKPRMGVELRPERFRPREPRKKTKDARPEERPIEPPPDRQ